MPCPLVPLPCLSHLTDSCSCALFRVHSEFQPRPKKFDGRANPAPAAAAPRGAPRAEKPAPKPAQQKPARGPRVQPVKKTAEELEAEMDAYRANA